MSQAPPAPPPAMLLTLPQHLCTLRDCRKVTVASVQALCSTTVASSLALLELGEKQRRVSNSQCNGGPWPTRSKSQNQYLLEGSAALNAADGPCASLRIWSFLGRPPALYAMTCECKSRPRGFS